MIHVVGPNIERCRNGCGREAVAFGYCSSDCYDYASWRNNGYRHIPQQNWPGFREPWPQTHRLQTSSVNPHYDHRPRTS